MSPWVLNNKILKKTNMYNINFHPGSPKYPGIGCFNFAILKNRKKVWCNNAFNEQKGR